MNAKEQNALIACLAIYGEQTCGLLRDWVNSFCGARMITRELLNELRGLEKLGLLQQTKSDMIDERIRFDMDGKVPFHEKVRSVSQWRADVPNDSINRVGYKARYLLTNAQIHYRTREEIPFGGDVENLLRFGKIREAILMGDPDAYVTGLNDIGYLSDCRLMEEAAWRVARYPNGELVEESRQSPLFPLLAKTHLAEYFLEGRDVRDALVTILEKCTWTRVVREDADLVMLLGALCVWTGQSRLLEALVTKASVTDMALDFLHGCQKIFSGEWAEADAKYKAFADYSYYNGTEEKTYRILPAFLLAMFVNIKFKVSRQRLGKLNTLIQWAFNDDGSRSSGHTLRMLCDQLVHALTTSYGDNFLLYREPQCSFVEGLLIARIMMETDSEGSPKQLMESAQEAYQMGYLTLAATFAGCLEGTASVAPQAEALAAQATSEGGVIFWKAEPPPPRWREALDEIGRTFKAPVKEKVNEQSYVIGWNIFLERTRGSYSMWECRGILPCYQKRLKNGNFSQWKDIPVKQFKEGKFDSVLEEIDRQMKATITPESGYGYSSSFFIIPPRALLFLCGHERVTATIGGDEVHLPIRLEKGEFAVWTEKHVGGGIDIRLPWGAEMPPVCGYLERIERDCFRYYAMMPSVGKLSAIIQTYGEDGVLTIPEEGVEGAADILGRVAQSLPLAGSFVKDGKGTFPVVEGGCEIHAQMRYKNEALEMLLRVKPLATDPLLCEPGVGLAERTMAKDGKTVILKRNLAVEKQTIQEVLTALPPMEDWYQGNHEWRIEDLTEALEVMRSLKALGERVKMEWPEGRSLEVAQPKEKKLLYHSIIGRDAWFALQGEFTLDTGKVISFLDVLEHLPERKGNFVQIDEGKFLQLTGSMVKKLETLNAAGVIKDGGIELSPAAVPAVASALEKADADELELPRELTLRFDDFSVAFEKKFTIPERFACTLRPYQEEAYVWLSRLTACGIGACLADDMGLGKTVEVMALLLARAKDGASLVVAPASVCGNWEVELARFAPTLRVIMAGETVDDFLTAGVHDVVICSYGLIQRREDLLSAREWNGVVLDEAQAIKNPLSKRAKSVKKLLSKFRIVATGTPVENRLMELWSIFDFLNPGLLGPRSSFMSRFTDSEGIATPQLKRLVAPLILRRLKRDVLDDLPEKTEITLPVILGDDERSAYEGFRLHAIEVMGQAEGEEARFKVLQELLKLRRFCCNPSLVLPGFEESAKLEALTELLEELKANHHRALIFSQYVDFLAIVKQTLDAHGWSYEYLDGATPTAVRGECVDAFQKGAGDFFLISLKAGGMGINLTAANYVILLDPWWNPAVENQAADRVYRIGQKQPVTIYRLIAKDTVEERVLEMHAVKNKIAEDVLDGTGDATLTMEMMEGLLAGTQRPQE